MSNMKTVVVAVSTNKVIHLWAATERAYGCGSTYFTSDYVPTTDNAQVDEDGKLTPASIRILTIGKFRLCAHCFSRELKDE